RRHRAGRDPAGPPVRAPGSRAHALRRRGAEGHPSLQLARQRAGTGERHRTPGNVRELENAIERAVILCESEKIPAELLGIDLELDSLDLEESAAEPSPAAPQSRNEPTENLSLEDYFQHFVLEHQEHKIGRASCRERV